MKTPTQRALSSPRPTISRVGHSDTPYISIQGQINNPITKPENVRYFLKLTIDKLT